MPAPPKPLRCVVIGGILWPMRRWVAWLGVVAGCYGPTPQAGLPCAANEACPTGQTCSVGICVLGDGTGSPDARTDGPIDSPDDAPPDAPAPDGPPSDLDADGIENLLDNCPTAQNADQHDEDGDEVGDVCDNCPHVANATQANVMEGNLGADAVGDACDPRPSTAGDTIERFISFHVQPAGVTTQGNWSLSQGAFVKAGLSYAELRVAGVREHYTVEVGGAQITSATARSWLVVTFGEADNQLHNCGYDEFVDDIHDGVLGHYDGTDWNWIFAVNHFLPNPLSGAFKIAVTADAAANRASCTTSDSRGTAATGSHTAPSLAPGVIGIRSEDMSYRIDYVIIFGSS